MRTEQGMKQVEAWMADQEALIKECTDSLEKVDLTHKLKSVTMNLGYIQNRLDKGKHYHFCKECGVIELATYTNSKDLIGKQLCYACNFWEEREALHLKKPNLIIDGMMYSDGGHKPTGKKEYLGHAGRLFHIVSDDGEEWITNNLWCGGTFPLKYRQTTMKDNARFL